jgi:long-chain acyl-CoA synthetase
MQKFKNIGQMFLQRCEKSQHRNAIGVIQNQNVQFISYEKYFENIELISLGLAKLNLNIGNKIAIYGMTCEEWHFFDLASLCMGAVVVPIYHTYTPSEVYYLLDHSESEFIVIEGNKEANNILKIEEDLSSIKHIFVMKEIDENVQERLEKKFNVHSLESIMALGKSHKQENPDQFERFLDAVAPSSLATIVYTSGTTGLPKGAMITHEAILQMLTNVQAFTKDALSEKDRTLTFLPLSHVFGRCDSLMPLIFGWEMVFAKSIDTLIHDLHYVKPTIMLAVPRIFEKIYAKIQETIHEDSGIKRELFHWSLGVADTYYEKIDNDKTPSTLEVINYKLAHKLVFKKIYEKFGGRIRYFISGGAPLSADIIKFLRNAELTILEGYGLTETIAPCSLNPFERQVPGTVGRPMGDVEVAFEEDNEILIKSKALFSGYYKNEEETQKAFINEWFRTGDIGRFNNRGYLEITDRKKDIIITSGGKNVAPQKIENLLKLQTHITNSAIYGDQQKYLVALIAIEKETFKLEALGIDPAQGMNELAMNSKIQEIIQREVNAVNSELASFEQIKKFHIIPMDVTTDNYLTPSLKLKKKLLFRDFAKDIEQLYT